MNDRDKELAAQLRANMEAACEAVNELNRRGWNVCVDFKFKNNDARVPYVHIHKDITL